MDEGISRTQNMIDIKILGTGCAKCKKLTENAETAAKQLGIEFEIGKVTDINEIMKFGVIVTPAIVINDEVASAGKALDVEDLKQILAQ